MELNTAVISFSVFRCQLLPPKAKWLIFEGYEHAGRQAGRQADGRAGRQAGRLAGRQVMSLPFEWTGLHSGRHQLILD